MKTVFILVKDDCDEYEGCITDVIGVFKLKLSAKKARRKNVNEQTKIEIDNDKFQKREKQDNFVRLHTKSGTITYLIEKKELQ